MARETKEQRVAREAEENSRAEEARKEFRARLPELMIRLHLFARSLGIMSEIVDRPPYDDPIGKRVPTLEIDNWRNDDFSPIDFNSEEWEVESVHNQLSAIKEKLFSEEERRKLALRTLEKLTDEERTALAENTYLIK